MRIPRWFSTPAPEEGRLRLPGEDGWAAAAGARLSELQWVRLAALDLETECGPRPWQNPEWRKRVELHRGDHRMVAAVAQLVAVLRDAVPIVPPRSSSLVDAGTADGRPVLVCERNTVTAVNALWTAARFSVDSARTAGLTGAILRRVLTEPWSVDSPLLRNTCVNILVEVAGAQAVDELMACARLVLDKRIRAQILLALDHLSPADAPDPDRVAELRVPRHGLDDGGRLTLSVHGTVHELGLLPSGDVYVDETADADTPGDDQVLHAVGKRAREIRASYTKELARIEDLLATQRTWTVADWRRLYLEHPITRVVARRLIWRLYLADGSVQELIPATAAEVPDGEGVRVELWHPGGVATAQSLARWRGSLSALASGQPFPQVGRWHVKQVPDPDSTFVTDYVGWETDHADFRAVAQTQRWHWQPAAAKARGDAGCEVDGVAGGLCLREYPEAKLTCALDVVVEGATVRCGRARFHRQRDRHRQPVPLGAVPYRVYSEAVRALALLAGARLAEDVIQDLPLVADAVAVADAVPGSGGGAE
jgi:hypothetical protein